MPEQYSRIRKLAEALMASCSGGSDEQDELNELSLDECKVLDTMALECQCCNQWFPAASMVDTGGKYLCKECVR